MSLVISLMDSSSTNAPLSIKVLNWNANGIKLQRSVFIDFLTRHNIDIACVNETHLTPSDSFRIPGFKIQRRDRLPVSAHGGVAIFVKSNLVFEAIPDLPMNSLELVGICLSLVNKKRLKLFATYLRPSKTLSLLDIRSIFNNNLIPTMLIGDMNCKHPAWFSRVSNPNGNKLFRAMTSSNWIVSAPDEPTFFPHQEDRIPDVLDVAVCQNISGVVSHTTVQELDSDHVPVIIEIDAATLTKPGKLKLINGPVDWEYFQSHLSDNIHIPSVFPSPNDIDNAVADFTHSVAESINTASGPPKYHDPLKYNSFVHLPFHLRSLITYKHRLRRKWQHSRSARDKKLLNIITRKLRAQLDEYAYENYQSYLEDIHPDDGTLWKETKRILRKVDDIPPLQNSSLYPVTSCPDKCEAFADHLEATFSPNLDIISNSQLENVMSSINQHPPTVELPVDYCSPQEVNCGIKLLKNKKAPGHDMITNEIVKMFPWKAVLFLTAVFNACFRLGYFPSAWKHAEVIVLCKPNKPKNSVGSYRPISLLPCLSKLFERVIHTRLKSIMEDWNVLPTFQFGFREGHSTIYQMMRFSEFVNTKFEERAEVLAVFLDLQAAFDKVWHAGLIYKIKKLNFPAYIVDIIRSFLCDRTFAVKIDDCFSSVRPIKASVPQGSVLGPFLFNIYTADMLQNQIFNINDFIGTFADDTVIACSSLSLVSSQARLQSLVDEVAHWCSSWGIIINTQKTVCKKFSLKTEKPVRPITINGTSIPWTADSIKWLGVWFDKRLTWGDHIKKKIIQAHLRLQLLFPILNKKSRMNMKTSLLIYKTILKPVITYAAPVWIPASQCHLKKLQIFQNKVLRIITKAPWFVRNENIQKDLKVESIKKFCVDRTVQILKDPPHGLGQRRPQRRIRPHLPQNLPSIVEILS
ncbi:hypothetical protein WDU94_010908 [Cyamophila willieti]